MNSMNTNTILNPMFNIENDEMESTEPNYQEMTILQLMEKVSELADDSQLSDSFFAQASPMTTILGERLGLTPEQCVFYSIFVDHYNDNHIQLDDISRQTRARMVRIAQFQSDIDEIEKKRYIRRTASRGIHMCKPGEAYYVPSDSMKDLRKNKPYTPKKVKNLSFITLMHAFDERIKERYQLGTPYEILVEDLLDLVQNNKQLKVCQQLSDIRETVDDYSLVLLVVMCICEMFHNKTFSLTNLDKIFEEDWEIDRIAETFEVESNILLQLGLVEFAFCNGVVDKDCLMLSNKAKKMFLSENKQKRTDNMSNLQEYSKINAKELFYDDNVKEQVERLGNLLSKKSFGDICKRLKQNKMRRGFACLFYGAPGTGKTETVLQLAKKTGRNIMQVDFSEVKNKYVGDSEKNVKAIFNNYREAVKSEKLCPILLFNEADAIIGRRLENVEHSVDNMYNTMQNIILQEMENFEGILIATTNLEGNMDPAFERRFLYKVRFEKPSANVRKQIWQSIIPSLSDEIALSLAKEFEFSGGQIENIARKQFVDSILYGEKEDVTASLRQYCKEETLQNRKNRPCVGFVS